jgi:hypothetical protein
MMVVFLHGGSRVNIINYSVTNSLLLSYLQILISYIIWKYNIGKVVPVLD